MAKNMLEETRDKLHKVLDKHRLSRSAERERIANEAGVNLHWLEKFDQGVITDPTWSRLYALHCHLKGRR